MKVIINHKKKKIKVEAKDCNFFKKFSGLMFSRSEKAGVLIFRFKRKQKIAIHSFFVFYPFIAVWLDEKNRVNDLRVVKPFSPCVSPKKESFSLVEIPINRKNKKIVKLLEGSDVFPSRIRKV